MKTLVFAILLVLPLLMVSQDEGGMKELTYISLCDVEEELSFWKGRVVFISFWSKTCGPCIRGFKRYAELRNELTDKGIVFLNVSIDSKADWLIAYERYRPVGINGVAKSFEKAQDDFEIFNLPVYVTIDEEGNEVLYDKTKWGTIMDLVDWMDSRKTKSY